MANIQANTIEEYLDQVDPDLVVGSRQMVTWIREALPGAEEAVAWGIAIFRRGSKDVTGVAARKGYYSLYVPHPDAVEQWTPRLGKVDAGKGCIRFKSLEDLDSAAYREMLADLNARTLAALAP